MGDRVTVGTLDELRRTGCLTGKVGTQPVCVFWSEGAPFALDGRFGLLEVFGGATAQGEHMTRDLGQAWAMRDVWFKVYPIC